MAVRSDSASCPVLFGRGSRSRMVWRILMDDRVRQQRDSGGQKVHRQAVFFCAASLPCFLFRFAVNGVEWFSVTDLTAADW